ncbi:hypothetical protein O181_061750 [Austropuccinia psidii MF-1]|uniref:Tf2-1-like SH3-like domain-containing protein n=1 Tax=Austropuccinia psidii MF-1 TaxID=1389203 RepID=A0A9Q3EN08_9BASI|nr:hypothetical protein [Austropuccinia psidii MF-1]
MGSPSHVSLKAAECVLLYKVYIPFLILSQQMSLDEHNSPKTKRKMAQSKELENELTKTTFHLLSAIEIATSWTDSMDDVTAFAEHWKKIRLSNQQLFPKNKSKPNHHFADHIPELFQFWGPAQASATWGYECLIGVFAKMPTNNVIYNIDKTLLQHICQWSNLSILLKSPSIPCEIKQLFESQLPSPFNYQKYNKPSFHDQQNYDCLSHKVPAFKGGDIVLVSTLNFNNIKGPKKLKHSYVGHFVIVALHGTNAVQVELSGELENKHPTFLVSLIKPYQPADKQLFPLRNPNPWTVRPVEQSEHKKINKAIKERRLRGKNQREYLVKDRNPVHEDEWLAESEISESDKLLRRLSG